MVLYSVTRLVGYNLNKYIFVSGRQLYIYLKDTIDYENENAYNLTMIFNDGHEDSTSYEVAFSVGDVNEPPSIQYSSYSMSVNESNVSRCRIVCKVETQLTVNN